MAVHPRWLAWVNGVLAAAFAAAAALQYNDPDPVRWVVIYGGAAVACAVYGRVRGGWIAAALVGAAALAWGAAIAAGIDSPVAAGDLFRPMEMKGGPVEETREAVGLGLTGLWMLVLVVLWHRRRGGTR